MITKIVSYSLLGMLFISFFLAIVGVTHVSTGQEYYGFLASISRRYESWKLTIPSIPSIPSLEVGSVSGGDASNILQVLRTILNFFKNVVNVFITFINVVVRFLNILIKIINVVIQVIQFVLTLLTSFKDLIDRLKELNTAGVIAIA